MDWLREGSKVAETSCEATTLFGEESGGLELTRGIDVKSFVKDTSTDRMAWEEFDILGIICGWRRLFGVG